MYTVNKDTNRILYVALTISFRKSTAKWQHFKGEADSRFALSLRCCFSKNHNGVFEFVKVVYESLLVFSFGGGAEWGHRVVFCKRLCCNIVQIDLVQSRFFFAKSKSKSNRSLV